VSDESIAPPLDRLGELHPKAARVQVIRRDGVDRRHKMTRVVSAATFLAGLV
jgi:hypothetical protein